LRRGLSPSHCDDGDFGRFFSIEQAFAHGRKGPGCSGRLPRQRGARRH
jgi:hypothetical protein